jgi:hypothetical protein
MLSGANAFEISDIQESETAEVPTKQLDYSSAAESIATLRNTVTENGLLSYLWEEALSSPSLRSANNALASRVRQPHTPSSHQNCLRSSNSKLSASPIASLAASAFARARSLLR